MSQETKAAVQATDNI